MTGNLSYDLDAITRTPAFLDADEETRQGILKQVRDEYIQSNPRDTDNALATAESVNKSFLRNTGEGRYIPKDLKIDAPWQSPDFEYLSEDEKIQEVEKFRYKIPEIAAQDSLNLEDNEFYLNQLANAKLREVKGSDTGYIADKGYRMFDGFAAGLASYVGAEEIADKIRSASSENPKYDEDFMATLFQGAGDMAASTTIFLGAALAGTVATGNPAAGVYSGTAATLATNGISRYNEAYRRSIEKGLSEEVAHDAGIYSLPGAAVDALGDKLIASKFLPKRMESVFKSTDEVAKKKLLSELIADKSKRGALMGVARDAFVEGSTEAAGDYTAGYGAFIATGEQDFVPKGEELAKSFAVGAILGGGISATMNAGTIIGKEDNTLQQTGENLDKITNKEKQQKVYDLVAQGKYKEAFEESKLALNAAATDSSIPKEESPEGTEPPLVETKVGAKPEKGSSAEININFPSERNDNNEVDKSTFFASDEESEARQQKAVGLEPTGLKPKAQREEEVATSLLEKMEEQSKASFIQTVKDQVEAYVYKYGLGNITQNLGFVKAETNSPIRGIRAGTASEGGVLSTEASLFVRGESQKVNNVKLVDPADPDTKNEKGLADFSVLLREEGNTKPIGKFNISATETMNTKIGEAVAMGRNENITAITPYNSKDEKFLKDNNVPFLDIGGIKGIKAYGVGNTNENYYIAETASAVKGITDKLDKQYGVGKWVLKDGVGFGGNSVYASPDQVLAAFKEAKKDPDQGGLTLNGLYAEPMNESIALENRAKGTDFRVHAVKRNGKIEIIPYATHSRDYPVPYFLRTPSVREVEQAALEALNAANESIQENEYFGVDVVEGTDGKFFVTELNPTQFGETASEFGTSTSQSGYIENEYVQSATYAHLKGRIPAFILAARKIIREELEAKMLEQGPVPIANRMALIFTSASDQVQFTREIINNYGDRFADYTTQLWDAFVESAGAITQKVIDTIQQIIDMIRFKPVDPKVSKVNQPAMNQAKQVTQQATTQARGKTNENKKTEPQSSSTPVSQQAREGAGPNAIYAPSPEGVAYPQATRGTSALASVSSADIIAELNKLGSQKEKLEWLHNNGFIQAIGGELAVDHSGRTFILARIADVNVPFYLSSGMAGKKDVASNQWYAVWGIGESGWINKGDSASINNNYGVPVLQKLSRIINEGLGPINPDSVPNINDYADINDKMNLGIIPIQDHNKADAFWDNVSKARLLVHNKSIELAASIKNNPAYGVDSDPVTDDQMSRYKKAKNVGQLLDMLAADDTFIYRDLALALNQNVSKFTKQAKVKWNKSGSLYAPTDHEVEYASNVKQETLIHEIVHAATAQAIGKAFSDAGVKPSYSYNNGAKYKEELEQVLASPNVSKAVKDLINLYFHTAKELGYYDMLFVGTEVKGIEIKAVNIANFSFRGNGEVYSYAAERIKKNPELAKAVSESEDKWGNTEYSIDINYLKSKAAELGYKVKEYKDKYDPDETVIEITTIKVLKEPLNKGVAGMGHAAAAAPNAGLPYGLANLEEFLSESWSDVEFKYLLNSLPSIHPEKSIWTEIKEAVLKIFPFLAGAGQHKTTLLDDLYTSSAELFYENKSITDLHKISAEAVQSAWINNQALSLAKEAWEATELSQEIESLHAELYQLSIWEPGMPINDEDRFKRVLEVRSILKEKDQEKWSNPLYKEYSRQIMLEVETERNKDLNEARKKLEDSRSEWDVEPTKININFEDSSPESIRASQFKVATHSTDIDSVASILANGLTAGSALDYTADKGWAGAGVSLVVPMAKKGSKIEHNGYYKAASTTPVGRVIIDGTNYADDVLAQAQNLANEFPSIPIEVINNDGTITVVSPMSRQQMASMKAIPSSIKLKRQRLQRLKDLKSHKIDDKFDSNTNDLIRAVKQLKASRINKLPPIDRDRVWQLVDNIFNARAKKVANPEARIDTKKLLSELESYQMIIDATHIEHMIKQYDGIYDLSDIDFNGDVRAFEEYVNDLNKKDEDFELLKNSINAKRKATYTKKMEAWRKSFKEIRKQILEKYPTAEDYVKEYEESEGYNIKGGNLRNFMLLHYDYLTSIADVKDMEGGELYRHFFAINNLLDQSWMYGARTTAKYIANLRDAQIDIEALSNKFRDPVIAQGRGIIGGIDALARATEIAQSQLDRWSPFIEAKDFLQEDLMGPLLESIMIESQNNESATLREYDAFKKEFEKEVGREMNGEDRIALAIASRLVQFEAGKDGNKEFLKNIENEVKNIVNIVGDPANNVKGSGTASQQKDYRRSVIPVFEQLVNGLTEVDNPLEQFVININYRLGLGDTKVGEQRAKLLNNMQRMMEEYTLDNQVISELFYQKSFKRFVNYMPKFVIPINPEQFQADGTIADEMSKFDDLEWQTNSMTAEPGQIKDRRGIGRKGHYSNNIEFIFSRGVHVSALTSATTPERFVLNERLKGELLSDLINGSDNTYRVDQLQHWARTVMAHAMHSGNPLGTIGIAMKALNENFARVALSGLHQGLTQTVSGYTDYQIRTGNIVGAMKAAHYYITQREAMDKFFEENVAWIGNRSFLGEQELDRRRNPSFDEKSIANMPLVKQLSKYHHKAGEIITYSLRKGDDFTARSLVLAEYARLIGKKNPLVKSVEDVDFSIVEGRLLSQAILNIEKNINASNKATRGEFFVDRKRGVAAVRNVTVAFSSHVMMLAAQFNIAARDLIDLHQQDGSSADKMRAIRTMGAILSQTFAFSSARYVINGAMAMGMISLMRDLFDDEEGKLAELEMRVQYAKDIGNESMQEAAEYELKNAKEVAKQLDTFKQRQLSFGGYWKGVVKDQLGSVHFLFNGPGIPQRLIFPTFDTFGEQMMKEDKEARTESLKRRIKGLKESGKYMQAAKLGEQLTLVENEEYLPWHVQRFDSAGLGGITGTSLEAIYGTIKEFNDAAFGIGEININDFILSAQSMGIGQADLNRFFKTIDKIEDEQFKTSKDREEKRKKRKEEIARERIEREDEIEEAMLLKELRQ